MNMDRETVVAAAGPADLIATVWFTLGYRPRDSLVLVGLEGPRRRAGMMLRVDFPMPGEPPGRPRGATRAVVRGSLATVARSGVQTVLALIDHDSALRRPSPGVVDVLIAESLRAGMELTDVLGVTSGGFGSLLCSDPRCCPVGGTPIEAVLSSRGAMAHVVNGRTMVDSEAELIADVTSVGSPVDPGRWPEAARLSGGRRLSPEGVRWWWERWLQARSRPTEPSLRAGLSAALHDPNFRDVVMMHVFGASRSEVDVALADPGSDAVAGLDLLLRRPPVDVPFSVAREALAGAARVAAVGDRGPALALLAMMAWFEGNGARSRLLVARARADVPRLSLTGLVDDLLAVPVVPPWMEIGPQGDEVDISGPESETDLGDRQ